jgi:hypothetical protein
MILHHLMLLEHFHLELEEPLGIFHASQLDKYMLLSSSYVLFSAIYQEVLSTMNTSMQEMWLVNQYMSESK